MAYVSVPALSCVWVPGNRLSAQACKLNIVAWPFAYPRFQITLPKDGISLTVDAQTREKALISGSLGWIRN